MGFTLGSVRRLLPIYVAALLAFAAPAGAESLAPGGFIGISPQGKTGIADLELMQLAGIESMRLPMSWAEIEPRPEDVFAPRWSSFDEAVAGAAEHGIRVFPFLGSTPDWVAPFPTAEPVESASQRRAWRRFIGDAVRRYGPGGEFWEENPS